MAFGSNVMSLYHQLETIEIPTISAFRLAPIQEPEPLNIKPMDFSNAPRPSFQAEEENATNDDDLFIRDKESQAQVQSSIPVMAVPERIYGQGVDNETKRLVYNRDDVNL